ncbi:TonB-dependent receptor protein [Ameyamaea chiangmaiensis NBRC 103196]|nr:TonB-dependent receptor [Ameyamaea chiangmaiensis]GBQ70333.1 TonB-dependent receptor protein [Ameyamaea chiangmaiensis NBRC 103196]
MAPPRRSRGRTLGASLMGATALVAWFQAPVAASAQSAATTDTATKPTPASHARHTTHASHTAASKASTKAAPAAYTAAPYAPVARPVTVTNAATNRAALATTPVSSDENIVVTGSMLRTSNNTNANPVQVITSRQIQQTSAATLGDYLQRLPSIGNSGAANTQTNGFIGVSCSDIRNLGSTRVLVLVDGKRTTQDPGAACVDMNTIPVEMISSVEILKDGGSELYGADAVSGVINIKLRHDLNTGNLTFRGGITDHADSRTGLISGFKGWNFDHDRGNITITGQYMSQGPVMQRDRDWSRYSQVSNDPGETPLYGSGYTAGARILSGPAAGMIANTDGSGFHQYTSADRYNYAQDQNLSNYLQSSTLTGDAHYQFNRHFNLYANVRYNHKTASDTMAASPVAGSIYPSTLANPLTLPGNAPYMQNGLLQGEDAVIQKRYTDLGTRNSNASTDNLQIIGGANGVIVGDWNYDASMTYGISQGRYETDNMGNYRHILEEYGIVQTNPSDPGSAVTYNPSVCNASAGCVLSSPFAPMSQQAASYAKFNQQDHAQYMLRDFNLRVNNDRVAKLPYKNGGNIGLAFGVEHRSEQLSYTPDPLAQNGDTTGNTQAYSGGGFNATEVYGEAKFPLLHNAFLAKDLTADAQGRWSHYNTFGNTQNWKVGLNWAPIRDIRFRATLGTSYRQPNVYELYGGQALGYAAATDPCAQASSYGGLSANVIATCARQGINTATFESANPGQVPAISGGNSKLQPEIGRTYTVGTVITPRWIPGLSASVEYWHYTIKNEISALAAQYAMDGCYTGSATQYCSDISRNSNQQLNYVTTLDANLGGLKTSGIDFDLDYRIRLSSFDTLTLSNNFQQLVSYLQQNTPGGEWYNYAGRLFYAGSAYVGGTNGLPRVTDYATATWSHGNFSFTYMMHYIGGMRWNSQSTENGDLTAATAGQWRTPGIFTHDVTVNYRLKQWNFEVGVNNILDKDPPFVFDAATNTANAIYSENMIGRYVFAQVGVNF